MTNLDNPHLTILPEVEEALKSRIPIVALESTVITHGLPYPENIQLANDVESEIRKLGGIPATIAVINGRICIGLDESQMECLVEEKNPIKISSRDIAPAIQKSRSGGTTVAGTLSIAASVGIKVFATGGIGGVHREALYDVSADLIELSRSRLVVVCAGAKAILDIGATLEVLETYAVPVVGYQTDDFPAFYSTSSGLRTSVKADSAKEVAQIANTHWRFGMNSSILVAAPPPNELALDRKFVEAAVQTSLEEVKQKGIRGQAVTPYLLRRVSELTGGSSLRTNLGLLLNNARIAAQIAQYIY